MILRRGWAGTITAAVAGVIFMTSAAHAMLQEAPYRRSVTNAVAVLRHLYEMQLDYENRADMVRRSIDGTKAQFDSLHAVMQIELEQPAPDVIKLRRFSDSMNDLLDSLQQYGPKEYIESLHRFSAVLDNAAGSLEGTLRQTERAVEGVGVVSGADLAEIRAGVTRLANALGRENLRQLEQQLITLDEMRRNFERELAGAAGATEEHMQQVSRLENSLLDRQNEVFRTATTRLNELSAIPAVRDNAALLSVNEDLIRRIAEAQRPRQRREVDELRLAEYRRAVNHYREEAQRVRRQIDAFRLEDRIDYESMFAERLADVSRDIAYQERVLDARIAEYRALFGAEPPVVTDYRAEVERFYPASRMGGILVAD